MYFHHVVFFRSLYTLLKLTSFKRSNAYLKLYLDLVIFVKSKLHGFIKYKELICQAKINNRNRRRSPTYIALRKSV